MSLKKVQSFHEIPREGFFFVALGGVGEIGLNFYLYGCDGEWIVVDCGIGFADDKYPGIDILIPDPKALRKMSRHISAIIITHAHEDHIGAVASLWEVFRCPIYVSCFAKEMLESRLAENRLLGRVDVCTFKPNDAIDLEPFEIECVPMNHSIPEAVSLLIKTKYGTVFHTGDWRFDDAPVIGAPADYKRLKALKKENILAVFGDSTNAGVQEDNPSEQAVKESLISLLKAHKGKAMLVTCFSSNVGRIQSIAEAAKRSGRQVCLQGRSLWRVEGAARYCGYLENTPDFLTLEEASKLPRSEVLYLCTGCQGEPKAALSQISYGKSSGYRAHPDDVIIFSSKVIPGNETAIENLKTRLLLKGVEIITTQEALVHTSGHANAKDIEKLYKMIKPKYVVPVHGEKSHLLSHQEVAKKAGVPHSLSISDGDVISLDQEGLEIIGSLPIGVLAREGNRIVELKNPLLEKRKKIIENGSVVVTVILSETGDILGEVLISVAGLLDKDDPLINTMKKSVVRGIKKISPETRINDELIIEAVTTKVRKVMTKLQKRNPYIDVHIARP